MISNEMKNISERKNSTVFTKVPIFSEGARAPSRTFTHIPKKQTSCCVLEPGGGSCFQILRASAISLSTYFLPNR